MLTILRTDTTNRPTFCVCPDAPPSQISSSGEVSEYDRQGIDIECLEVMLPGCRAIRTRLCRTSRRGRQRAPTTGQTLCRQDRYHIRRLHPGISHTGHAVSYTHMTLPTSDLV